MSLSFNSCWAGSQFHVWPIPRVCGKARHRHAGNERVHDGTYSHFIKVCAINIKHAKGVSKCAKRNGKGFCLSVLYLKDFSAHSGNSCKGIFVHILCQTILQAALPLFHEHSGHRPRVPPCCRRGSMSPWSPANTRVPPPPPPDLPHQ